MKLAAVTFALALIGLGAGTSQTPALADFQDGGTLAAICAQDDPHAVAYCAGYTAAIADVFGNVGEEDISYWIACIPEGATQGQVMEVVKAWLEAHPHNHTASASDNVAQALANEFKCPD